MMTLNDSSDLTQVNQASDTYKLRQQQGFSLLECLCMLILIAVISAISFSSWQTFKQKQTLLAATESVLSTLQTLKKQASQRNQTLEIFIEQYQQQACLRLSSDKNCFLTLDQIEMTINQSMRALIFYGERATAQASTVSIKNNYAETKLIIATFNRIRACSADRHLTGLDPC